MKNNRGEKALKRAPSQAPAQLERIHADTLVGMAFSNVVAFFIILTAAATLHLHGLTNISTCAQAASALEPIAGRFAGLLFVCGIVGTGLLAISVLAASAAYGIGEGCGWKTSLERKPVESPRFYGAIGLAMVIGLFDELFPHRSGKGAGMGGGPQRTGHRTADGRDHAHGDQQ